jgi:hypothetical protein
VASNLHNLITNWRGSPSATFRALEESPLKHILAETLIRLSETYKWVRLHNIRGKDGICQG